MALATDMLVQKATGTTTQATLQKLVPQLWAAEIERNLRKRAVFQQAVIENTDLLVPGAGDTVYIPSLPDLPMADDLTEGTDMTDLILSAATSVPFTPSERGKSVAITRKALDRIKYDGIAQIMDRLTYSMSLKIEGAIASLATANVPGTSGSGFANGQLTQVYANAKTSATITASDVVNDDLLHAGKEFLEEQNNVPFDDNMWIWFISPKQYRNLLQDANVRQDLRYAQPSVLLRGEVGVLQNCHVVVTNYVTSQVENGVTVFNSLLVAPRWAAMAWKRRPELVLDPTLYDFGRRRRMAITADYDIQLLHNERAVVVKSA